MKIYPTDRRPVPLGVTVERQAAKIDKMQADLTELRRRESILADAMAEIKASLEGTSGQPLMKIVEGCIHELRQT